MLRQSFILSLFKTVMAVPVTMWVCSQANGQCITGRQAACLGYLHREQGGHTHTLTHALLLGRRRSHSIFSSFHIVSLFPEQNGLFAQGI